jgi:hypothetical protein
VIAIKPKHPAGPPMTLSNLRAVGVRGLNALCLACRREVRPDVEGYADDVPVR